MKRIFVVDGNWFLHRAFSTLKTNRKIEEALPYHFLSMIVKEALIVRASYLLVAFDGASVFRYSIYPEYKSNRSEKAKSKDGEYEDAASIYSYLPQVFSLLEDVGIAFFQPRKFEADDVLCSVATAYSKTYEVICGTQDKDAYQYLLTKNVKLFYMKKSKPATTPYYVDRIKIEKLKGIKCKQMIDYQTLLGDSGDGVPNLPGMGPAKARSILKKYGSIREWYANGTKEDKRYLRTHVEALKRNQQLVSLVSDVLPDTKPEQWVIKKKKPDNKFLTRNYHEYHNFVYPKSKGLFG